MKRTKIEEIVNLYKSYFPMGWADGYDWSDKEKSITSLEAVSEKVSIFEQEVFYLFAQSVLSGEYIVKGGLTKTLDAIYELVSSGEIFEDGENSYKTAAVSMFNDMTYEQGNVIRNFKHLLTILENKYKERPVKYIVNAYRVKHSRKQGSRYGLFYDMLIEITRIDHFLSSDKGTIRDLILYHSELKKGMEDKNHPEKNMMVLDIMNQKCLFLLKKLLIEDEMEFDFLIDFEHNHYDARKLNIQYFAELDRKFEFYRAEYYGNNSFGNELDSKERQRDLQIGQFSLLMKYYKDSKKTDATQIENILSDFDKLYKVLLAKFTKRPLDHYALGTLKNYMYNSRFSFMMKAKPYSFEQLRKDLDEIMQIQHQTGILNFYPYRKAFDKALELFRANKELAKDVMDEYKDFMRLCIEKFAEAIQWCKAYCFYPIQLVYKECLAPVQGFGAVFVASSFCRPVKYEKLRDELDGFKNQALLVENEIALRIEKEELKTLKNDIDHSRTREIEMLSVFTGIITFLFGTIGFFAENKNNDFLHLIFSVFGLGSILMMFVSGIHLITMRKEGRIGDYFKHPRAWFCFFTILASIALLIWLVVKVNALEG